MKKQGKSAKYKGVICRGCWVLGNNCGYCEKCRATDPRNGKKINEH